MIGGWIYIIGMNFCKPGPEYETTRDIYPVLRRAAAVKARVVRPVPFFHFRQLLTVRRCSPSP